MAVLGDALRSRILVVVERGELTVGELCRVVQAPQSTVSRSLKTLLDGGWVVSRADGTNRRYAMASGALDPDRRALWMLVRKEVTSTSAARQDERRLGQVIAARRSRSEEFFRSGAGAWDRLRDDLFGRRFVSAALLGLLDGDAVVADLGCGTGQTVEALAPFVSRVIGVDGSAAMLAAARKRLSAIDNVELREGSLESLPIDDASLDAATMFLVLHHVAEPRRALSEAARALKPGGRLVLVDMLPHDRESYREEMGHVWLGFRSDVLEGHLAAAGFEAVRTFSLPPDSKAKGPKLFAARAVRGAAAVSRVATSSRRNP